MKGFTHGGIFHADDVFATALLMLVYPDIVIERGTSVPENYEGIVYDIGDGRFDHHQEGAPVRDNGVAYAAFGLLWREYGERLVGKEQAQVFDEDFVQMIDITDNTGKMNPLSKVIKEFNPEWGEEVDSDERFREVVKYSVVILKRKLQCLKNVEKQAAYLAQARKQCDGPVLILDRYVPTRNRLCETDIQFVIYPSAREGFNIGIAQSRTPGCFPKSWHGLSGTELEAKSGVPGLTFCHRSGFIASAASKEAALRAARILVDMRKERSGQAG